LKGDRHLSDIGRTISVAKASIISKTAHFHDLFTSSGGFFEGACD